MRTLILAVALAIIVYVLAVTFGTAVIEYAEHNLNGMFEFIIEQLTEMFKFLLCQNNH